LCPHADIRFCPLYHAAHMGAGLGCDDGRLDEGGCGIDRGVDYAASVARLNVADPRLAPTLRFQEETEQFTAQRRRNMRALGIH
jgi:transposase